MASKSEKRRRKRRQAHQQSLTGEIPGGDGEAAEEEPSATPAPSPKRAASSGPRRAERRVEEERPPAPWGSFPLIELTVLAGIIMIVVGFVAVGEDRRPLVVGTGVALAALGGLEVAIREHFAGFRSHTSILAAFPAAIVLAILFYAGPDGLPPIARAAIAAAIFGAAAFLLVRIFRNRSGGHSVKFTRLPGR